MALTTGTVWEIRTTATAGALNGGGFNRASAGFLTDLTTDTNTANTASPVVSSASYNFVAGDVGAKLYVASGTNWTAGWYPIASVAANKATLSAAVGEAIQIDSASGEYVLNTVAGCATVGTPTGGTFGVDYSQQDASVLSGTDITTSGAAATTITSATGGFRRSMVGNIIHITTTGGGFVDSWYEIVTFTDTNNVVLDRTPTPSSAGISATFHVGGAILLDDLEDAFFEVIPAGSRVWVKSGTYTGLSAWSMASTNSTTANPSFVVGYTTVRGDTCNGTDRPLFDFSSSGSAAFGQNVGLRNVVFTATVNTASLITLGTGGSMVNCRVYFSTTVDNNTGVTLGADGYLIGCDLVCNDGIAVVANGARPKIIGCYIHDSLTGISSSATGVTIIDNIVAHCATAAVTLSSTSGAHTIINNTFYGREAKFGIGLNISGSTSPNNIVINNIFYGLTTGITVSTAATAANTSRNNNFFNNTTDATNWAVSRTSLAVDPQFTSAVQLSGTTATTVAATLTDTSANFSTVNDGVDYLHVLSGTGVTVSRFRIVSHTTTTVTVNPAGLGTSSAGNVVYFIPTNTNFAVGPGLKAQGFPSAVGTSDTTTYPDIGGAQRREAGTGSFPFVN